MNEQQRGSDPRTRVHRCKRVRPDGFLRLSRHPVGEYPGPVRIMVERELKVLNVRCTGK